MPRIQNLLCSGFCLMNITVFSQGLPKHPTSQQIAGYQLHEQKQWINSQQPKNSVLYQLNNGSSGSGSLNFTLGKKEKTPPLFQSPIGYVDGNTYKLGPANKTLTTSSEKVPPVGQFAIWRNSSKWKHLFDGGYHFGLISF